MADLLDRISSALTDRYTVERGSGRGGMAVVCLAHDRKLDRPVALKVLLTELAATLGGKRFVREIEIAANLTHPNIRSLHDCGEVDGLLYDVMPYVEGESLLDRLGRMMRRRLLTTICIALFTLAVGRLCAQDISVGGRLGAVGGGVWFEDEEANDLIEPMLGFQIGGVAAYRFSSILSAQAELWYIQKGWTETRAGGRRRFTYVELPLFVTATAPWSTAPQLLVGASVSLELGCSVTGVPDVGSVGCDDPRVEWRHTTAQFGTWAGLGVRRQFGVSHLDLQLLGNLNLTNLSREPLPRGYTRLLSVLVSAAYVVPLGGRTP